MLVIKAVCFARRDAYLWKVTIYTVQYEMRIYER